MRVCLGVRDVITQGFFVVCVHVSDFPLFCHQAVTVREQFADLAGVAAHLHLHVVELPVVVALEEVRLACKYNREGVKGG